HLDGGLAPRVLRGLGLGALMAALAVSLAVVVDRAKIHLTHDWSRWPAAAVPLGVGFLLAALSEELLFRGFPLRRLADAIGPWAEGGAFGPEGGAVTTLVLIAGTLAVLGARVRRPREWLVA